MGNVYTCIHISCFRSMGFSTKKFFPRNWSPKNPKETGGNCRHIGFCGTNPAILQPINDGELFVFCVKEKDLCFSSHQICMLFCLQRMNCLFRVNLWKLMENYKCGHKVNFLSAENDDMTHPYHHWRIHFGFQKGLCGLYRMPPVAPCEQWLGLWLVAVYKGWNTSQLYTVGILTSPDKDSYAKYLGLHGMSVQEVWQLPNPTSSHWVHVPWIQSSVFCTA